MAEPAPQLPDPRKVYDQDDEEPVTQPNLTSVPTGGETSEPKRGHLRAVREGESSTSPEELEQAEQAAPGDQVGRGYTGSSPEEQARFGEDQAATGPYDQDQPDQGLYHDDGKDDKQKPKKGRFSRRQKLIGGGVVAGVVGGGIFAFLALLPLRINNIVENAQSRFFGSSESAVGRYSDTLFSHYVKKHVLPSLGPNCRSTLVNKSCVATIAGQGQLSKLYTGWRDANLEGELARKHGIEFELRGTNLYIMKVDKEEFNLDRFIKGEVTGLSEIIGSGRAEVRARYHSAFEGETWWKKAMHRLKGDRLLERKFALKRCVAACESRDKFADWKGNTGRAAKVWTTERVLSPLSTDMGLLFECILNGGCEGKGSNGVDGEKRDKFQEKLDAKMAQYASRFGREATDALIKNADKVVAEGFTKYLVEKIFKEEAAASVNHAIDKGVPVIGWINTVANFVGKASKLGGQYRRWVYIILSTAMVRDYMLYRTQADELKSGNVDISLLGSMNATLGGDAGDAEHQGQPAEVSPLYENLLGGSNNSPKAALSNLLDPSASATAASSSPQYTCDNSKPPENGKLICSEESLKTNNTVTAFSDALNQPPLDGLTGVANFWNASAGKVLNLLGIVGGSILQHGLEAIPGYNEAAAKVSSLIEPFLTAVAEVFIHSPISDHMSGARAFNMLAGGADVAGNFFAHFGLGGHMLTPAQAFAIQNQQEEQARLQFAQKPLLARLFSKDDTRSMISQVAMALPSSASSLGKSLASLSNPFSASLSSFSSLLAGKHVQAAGPTPDPFGISQYGYALDDPALNSDPEIYTDDYCAKMDKDWVENHQVENPDTGVFEHTQTNPCRLVKDAIASAGAVFTDSVLEPDDTQYNPGVSLGDPSSMLALNELLGYGL